MIGFCEQTWAQEPYGCVNPGTNLTYASYNKRGKIIEKSRMCVDCVKQCDTCKKIYQIFYALDKFGQEVIGGESLPDTTTFYRTDEGIVYDWSELIDDLGPPVDLDTAKLRQKHDFAYDYG